MNAAERMMKIRKAFHMNRSEFAECLGISNPLIGAMESGKTGVSKKTAAKMQDTFLISPAWLQYGVGDMFVGKNIDAELILNRLPCRGSQFRGAGMTIEEWIEQMEKREQLKNDAPARMVKIRNAFQINQNQLAAKLGYTRAYISALEKGINKPSKKFALLMEAELGISAKWLLYGYVGQ